MAMAGYVKKKSQIVKAMQNVINSEFTNVSYFNTIFVIKASQETVKAPVAKTLIRHTNAANRKDFFCAFRFHVEFISNKKSLHKRLISISNKDILRLRQKAIPNRNRLDS